MDHMVVSGKSQARNPQYPKPSHAVGNAMHGTSHHASHLANGSRGCARAAPSPQVLRTGMRAKQHTTPLT